MAPSRVGFVLLCIAAMAAAATAEQGDATDAETQYGKYGDRYKYSHGPKHEPEYYTDPAPRPKSFVPFTFTVYEKVTDLGRHGPPIAAWELANLYNNQGLSALVGNLVQTGIIWSTTAPYPVNWVGDAQFTLPSHTGGVSFSGRGLYNVSQVETYYVTGGSGDFFGASGTVRADSTVNPPALTLHLLLPKRSAWYDEHPQE